MWPKQVIVLDESCNFSGPYGNPTKGHPPSDGFPQAEHYPNTFQEWVTFSFRDSNLNSNHLSALEYFSTFALLGRWRDTIAWNNNHGDRNHEYFRLYSLTRPYTIEHYNYRNRITYHLAWAIHGYIGFPSPVSELLTFITNCPIFQKLESDAKDKVWVSPFKAKPNAKKKPTPIPKKRRPFIPGSR